MEKWKFKNLEFGDFFGGGEVEENLLIGVKKRSIINSKKIISKIIIRGGKVERKSERALPGAAKRAALKRSGAGRERAEAKREREKIRKEVEKAHRRQ